MNIQKAAEFAQHTYQTAPKTAAQETQKKTSTQAADNTDKVITEQKNTTAYSPAYTKETTKSYAKAQKGNAAFDSSKSALQMKNEAMKSYARDTLSGVKTGGESQYKALFGDNPVISSALQAAEKTSEKYDDYWGVDATAERIFTFAKSLAGEDEEMLSKMKDAFLTGFKQALGVKKGKLPDISYQTKDKVLEMFADYEKELGDKKNGVTTDETENKDDEKKSETQTKNSTPYVGAGKYGTTPPPTKYSGGNTISYYGDEKYGSSYTKPADNK